MLTEDLVTLAVLRTGRTVQYEFSRRDEFTIAPTRHPMRVRVRLGADTDGRLTAMHVDQTMDTGGVRQPRHRRHVPLGQRVRRGVPVPGQAGGRGVGVHEQPAIGGRSAGTASGRWCSRSSPRWTSWRGSSASTRSSSAGGTSSCPVTRSS
ncbi:molybdopterin cofactor-binding domain-containing protein [Curtobacterium sp. MCJR17_043]|uniref:molybdopterin cofactor-binding domain-containing protein n=1 Tax=Curtobacterium sp. MCJR17_043 TaxID=2175660 RepID=UPI0032E86C0F